MTTQFNPWWLLPVTTLALGLLAGQYYFSSAPAPVAQVISTPPSIETNSTPIFEVVTVALPPAPVYQPQLEATIVNNKVVVHKEQTKARVATEKNQTIDNDSLLAQRFNQVLTEMDNEQQQPVSKLHPQALTLYPQWYQDLVPPLEFTEHIYSSEGNDSRVRVNNQIVKEGELIDSRMRIVKIKPQQVIIQLQQRQFSLPALSSW